MVYLPFNGSQDGKGSSSLPAELRQVAGLNNPLALYFGAEDYRLKRRRLRFGIIAKNTIVQSPRFASFNSEVLGAIGSGSVCLKSIHVQVNGAWCGTISGRIIGQSARKIEEQIKALRIDAAQAPRRVLVSRV